MPDHDDNKPVQSDNTESTGVIYSDKVEREETQLEDENIEAAQQDKAAMSLIGHLEELRRRLITMIAAIAIGSTACYFYAAEITALITAPAGKLYYMNPSEAFFTYLKVSFFAGFLLALPVVMYQLWAFIVPAMTNNERKAGIFLVPVSIIFFFIGLIFSYYLVLPAGIKFFMGFATENLQPMFSIGQYLSFVISFLVPFGFIFELPLFILVLAKLGIINSRFLVAKRKMVLVLSFVLGAAISPTPDVVSQTMVAVPVVLLYEISIVIVKYILRK
ncbi:twin-arginine translocase subunit TatC [Sporomusa acidovorans]|uniref:Sec-independent protein translocase protein TatC n=1 Tax=Sporomusa acidovorans (strain ATCC 49682 / DSM 3132 / Mol) TaxID=1123286 RepID=A0ABZ3J0J0_SPOA4|nr:twin-arginine translocase subunit TatC [Sporomusa acidovorans]OZC14463.1 Sec-independent protein translocase protein TatC [Sporomusa acidovorans DSM 3132]SDF49809.1 sec-independent protein translocase protein TatC [Sporomusa acidovorans]